MTTFNLPKSYIKRIKTTFERYSRIRALIHENVREYVDDFRNFHGTNTERYEYLEQKYTSKAPTESYIAVMENGKILFHVYEIALLTGRDTSSTSRTLAKIESLPGWCARLLSLRHEAKSANNNMIYVYDEKIFDLIIDYREHVYLEKVRRGGAVDFSEVMRYWEYLKNFSQQSNSYNLALYSDDEQKEILPDIPPMSWSDVMRLIGSKLFTVRAEMIFAMTFALSFILARKWPVMIPCFAGMSAVMLLSCAFMLRVRTSRTGAVSDAGAVALLLLVFWGVNLTLEGRIYTPGGTVYALTDEYAITLDPVRGEMGGRDRNALNFWVTATNELLVKEIFWRANSDGEYHSTGFTELGRANFRIEPGIDTGKITLDVKYLDTDNIEHGPYSFAFDIDKERFRTGKNLLLKREEPYVSGTPFLMNTIIETYTNDTVAAVCYGVNTPNPDSVFFPKLDEGQREKYSTIGYAEDGDEYISSFLIFTDGTSSDTRIYKIPRH